MPTYKFQAKAEDGRMVKGELEASSESEARVRLRAQKLAPLQVGEEVTTITRLTKVGKSAKRFNDHVSAKDLQVFTRQFAVLVAAGVPIVQSLDSMSKGARSVGLTNTLERVTADVERGRRLADALAAQPHVFDRLYVNLVRAGEESGALEAVLERLAQYIETSVKMKGKIVAALWYPAIIIAVAVGVISIILLFVVPKISALFTSNGKELPGLTMFVIHCSEFVQHYWYMLLGILIGVPAAVKTYYDTPGGRATIDAILIETPIFGSLIQKGAIARFSRTLATLLSSGVRILDALDIAAGTAGNDVLEKGFLNAKVLVSKGRPLAEPLGAIPHIPKMVTQMIAIGETTGNIDQMLNKVADFYEDEVDNATAAMTSMIEPILMVILGSIVAVIVIAMYLPIFNLAGAVG